jgi:hypothetical protein
MIFLVCGQSFGREGNRIPVPSNRRLNMELDISKVYMGSIGKAVLIGYRGHKEMSSILAGGGGFAGSQPMSTAVHMEPK